MLRIVGGSFGVGGQVHVDYAKKTVQVVSGPGLGGVYEREQVSGVDIAQTEQRKFSVFSLILGLIVITPLAAVVAALFFGLWFVGFVVGLLLTVVGSFHTEKKSLATFQFVDGKQVRVGGPHHEVNQLAYL